MLTGITYIISRYTGLQKGLGNYLTYMFVISMKQLTRIISGVKEGLVATLIALEYVVHHHSSKPVVVTTIILVP